MEFIHRTLLKKMNPKKGFTAPYIRFAWGYDRTLIGKPVSIYKVDGGFFVSLESNEFKPVKKKKTTIDDTCFANNKCKPIELENPCISTLESQISTQIHDIEKSSEIIDAKSKTALKDHAEKKVRSGRSKPPSVLAAFSLAPNPDGYRALHCPVLACTRRDSPFHRILFVNAQRVTCMETMLLAVAGSTAS